MCSVAYRRGHALVIVLMVVVVVSCFFTVLLSVPGRLYGYVNFAHKELQQIYDAESAIMSHLYRVPEDSVRKILPVEVRNLGAYREICAPLGESLADSCRRLCVQTVGRYRDMGYREWQRFAGEFRTGLYRRVEFAKAHRRESGNKRIFSLDSSLSLHVVDGDLRLDVDGRVPSANFIVDGDVKVSGKARYDTLRIFAQGRVDVGGNLQISMLEVFASDEVEIRGNVNFRGVVFSQRGFVIGGKSVAAYPSFAVAVGFGNARGMLADKASFAGLLVAPGGEVSLRSSALYDSSTRVLPAFDETEEFVFNRNFVQ